MEGNKDQGEMSANLDALADGKEQANPGSASSSCSDLSTSTPAVHPCPNTTRTFSGPSVLWKKQTSLPRYKCAGCRIAVHTICLEQLEKPCTVRHHWVHRRRQDGKCRQCGKGFQQKFFHNKVIVAISCSWCKQYHNKVTCFMLQHIGETCTLGAHAAVIVPPTWIIRVRKQQASLNSNKRRKKTSLKRGTRLQMVLGLYSQTDSFSAHEARACVRESKEWWKSGNKNYPVTHVVSKPTTGV